MRPYFAGLDNIRTYAFLAVFVSHAYFSFFTVTPWGTRWFGHGEVGVQMFFVLSAFLITYLSLSEYAKTGTFSVLHFFKKRILRIWPVYFLVLFISYIWYLFRADVTDILGCTTQFAYFFGNNCMVQGIPNIIGSATVGPMWSVSVEQQFYIVFPLALMGCIYFFKNIRKHITPWLIHITLAFIFVYALCVRFFYAENWNYITYTVVTSLPAFITGLYLAYGVHKKSYVIDHIRAHQHIYSITACISFFSFLYIKFLGTLGVSLYILPIIYTTCIWIVLATGNTEKKEQTRIQYLGKISYGLYAYHMFAIVCMQYFFERTQPIFSSILALSMTIILAHISYKYFESWFLNFK